MTTKSLPRFLVAGTLALLLAAWTGRVAAGATYYESAGQVVIEAEHFADRTTGAFMWTVVPTEGTATNTFTSVRGGEFVQLLPDSPNNQAWTTAGAGPIIEFDVHINNPGTWDLFLRPATSLIDGGAGAGQNADSLFVRLEGVSGWSQRSLSRTLDFHWEQEGGWTIASAGDYTIQISGRENGAALDTIMIQHSDVTDAIGAPTGEGPPESSTSPVPEPATLALLGLGGLAIGTGAVRRRGGRRKER